jgi:hypothetical protein
VYSNEKENDTSGLSFDELILIFKFAHEMQVDSLVVQLDVFFKETKASEIFGVYNLYQETGHQDYLGYCEQVCPLAMHFLIFCYS